MSGQVDPWDAMVQNDGEDEDYNFTGADGIDDEDQDFEPQDDDDDYRDVDEDDTTDDDEFGDLGDIVLSPCTLSFSCVTSAERGTRCFAQTSNLETMENQTLPLWLRCRNSSPMGRVLEW